MRSSECLPLFRRNVNLMECNIFVIIRRDDFTFTLMVEATLKALFTKVKDIRSLR